MNKNRCFKLKIRKFEKIRRTFDKIIKLKTEFRKRKNENVWQMFVNTKF